MSLMDSSTSYLKRTKVISYYLFPVTYYLKKVISYSLLFIPYSLMWGYSHFARYCLQGKACRFVVLSLCIMDYELCIMNYAL